jgi:LacI family transcriptional regulator
MQARGLPIWDGYLREGDLQISTGRRLGLDLLRVHPPPTAVISSNNKILLGLVGAISELGIPCPGGISTVGFDDSIWTEYFTRGLTVIAQPTYEIGRAAFSMLLSRMKPKEGEPDQEPDFKLFPAELRVRGSTGPPPVGSTPLTGSLRTTLVSRDLAGRAD